MQKDNSSGQTTILDVMTSGIAERPAQNGLSRTLTLEEKAPRVQTKHRLDATAAFNALTRAGYEIVAVSGGSDVIFDIIRNARTMPPAKLIVWLDATLKEVTHAA